MAARVSCRLGHRHRVDLDDPRRTEPSFLAGEHMPESWRELHRATVLLKCDGPAQQGSGVSPPGNPKLSLADLGRTLRATGRSLRLFKD
jgi:hypothetical protein